MSDTIVSFIVLPIDLLCFIYFIYFDYVILFYFIYLFLSVGLYVFYLFYLFILFIVLFLSFILFYFIYLFTYLLFIYFFVCGAVNVRVWMSRLQFCILNECECGRVLHFFNFNIYGLLTPRALPRDFYSLTIYLWYPGGATVQLCDDIPPRPANRGGIIIVTRSGWGACPPAFSCSAHAGGAFVPRNEYIYSRAA